MDSHSNGANRNCEKTLPNAERTPRRAGHGQSDAALKESESRFKDVIEIASDWIWEMDENLHLSFISDRFFEVFPISRSDIIGKTRQEFSGISRKNKHWRAHLDDLANHRPFHKFEYTTTQADGRPHNIQVSGKPVFDASGVFKGYRGTGTDKTAETEARKALEESERQFRNLVEGSIQGVFVHKDWQLLFANQALADILGYDNLAEMLALERTDPFLAPEEHDRLWGYKLARERGEFAPEVYEARCLKKDGSSVWLELRVKSVEWRGQGAMQCVAIDINERKKAEEALKLQKAEVDEILANVPRAIITIDEQGIVKTFNPSAQETFGYSAEEMIGHNVTVLIPKPQRKLHEKGLRSFVKTGTNNLIGKGPKQLVGLHKSGREFPMELAVAQIGKDNHNGHDRHDGHDGQDRLFVGVARDITDQIKAEEELRQQNERFNAALSNMVQGLCMFDSDQRVIVSNERYATMYGLTLDQVKPGTPYRQILEQRIANNVYADNSPQEYLKEGCAAVLKTRASKKTLELTDGRVIVITYQPTSDGGWLDTHEDITEVRQAEKRLAHLAHHDDLTNLPNRVLLRERMEQEMKRARRGSSFAVLCLDLDGFKHINDTLGHMAGDQLLKVISERLRSSVRDIDTVARLGGDEFAIIQSSTKQPLDSGALATRICELTSQPVQLGQNEVVVEMSIGIALASTDGDDCEQLLKRADMALYQTKQKGRGTYCYFKPEMEASLKDRHTLALDLRKALADEQCELYYQPLINIQDNKVSGFEALLRWHHPERGMVSPADFIPIAEETGLINQLGKWVLQQACHQAMNWPEDIKVAVNVSPLQIRRGNLLQIVKDTLTSTGLSPARLEIEITESVLLQDKDVTLAMLHQLHDLGVQISMDDFGTGYSSLSYLQSFPFDKIKIDSSFVKTLSKGDDGIGIVQAVVGFASRLGVATTAEGVETEEQLNIVRKEGCTQAQGYFFARPMPASDISLVLLRQLTKKMENAA